MPRKILFIKLGSFSFINESILKILETEFQEYEVDVLDVKDFWKNASWAFFRYLINIFFLVGEYGKDLVLGRKPWNELFVWFFGTSYMMRETHKAIQKFAIGKDYLFTLQTQALFNAKLDGVPNFIYTDNTVKVDLLYPDIEPGYYMRSERFINEIENKIYQDADLIFICGSLVNYSLQHQYHVPPHKLFTVFAGSNVENHFVENDEKYSSKNILFVGVDWERKGGPVLVKVFEKLLEKYKDASLTIIGCSPQNVNLQNCHILGKLPPADLAKYYNQAAVFCLPTLREPFGIVFVEAMHYRLPIVANNIGCIPDMVTNDFNGYLIDNDVDGYVAAFGKIFDDPALGKKLGENGFEHAQSKFTWELVGEKMKAEIVKYLDSKETANPKEKENAGELKRHLVE